MSSIKTYSIIFAMDFGELYMLLSKLFVIGFSHHNADVKARTIASFGEDVQKKIYSECLSEGVNSVMILNTCNRSEIYGIGGVNIVHEILFRVHPELNYISKLLFIKNGETAVNHLLKVASGLDSKIIGDLEILSQFKKSISQSKEYGMLNGVMEKLTNHCIAAAKDVRTRTKIGSGTISSSYAVVKKIKNSFYTRKPEILIIGAGKYGISIAKKIIQHLPEAGLTICNRTNESAVLFSEQLNVNYLPFHDLYASINQFNIIISCISKDDGYIINPCHIDENFDTKWFFDLSVPLSISPILTDMNPNFILYNIDDISVEIQSTLEARLSDLHKAIAITSKYQSEILEWISLQDYAWLIREWKNHIKSKLYNCPKVAYRSATDQDVVIEESIKKFAVYLKNNLSSLQESTPETIFEGYFAHTFKLKSTKNFDLCVSSTKLCNLCQIA